MVVRLALFTVHEAPSDLAAAYSRDKALRMWLGVASNSTLPIVAACSRIRNEGRYLREWLEFHEAAGVRYFYVYDDNSSDGSRAVLKEYADKVWVWPMVAKCGKSAAATCADRTHDALHGELGFRDACLRANPARADWILMTDVDEFMFPATGLSIPEHLANNCDSRLAYALVRWHVFGAAGYRRRPRLSSPAAYRERGREDDTGCYPRLTCGDEYSPPICAKVVARPRCVRRQGTHYVVKAQENDECVSIYSGDRKLAAVADSDFARTQHQTCAAPLHLNHYAVRSRQDYVDKFERGRISSGARDARKGFGDASEDGIVTRTLDKSTVEAFLRADGFNDVKKLKASSAASRAELMLVEFARRDHSEVLDEAILKYASFRGRDSHLVWACDVEANATTADAREAASAWLGTAAAGIAFATARKTDHRLAFFVHIPKTAGTTLDAILERAAAAQGAAFTILRFKDLEKPAARARVALKYDVVSAETDVSILASLSVPRTALFTFLREPLARVASQYEHHLASGRLADHETYGDIIRVVSPHICSQLERDAQCAGLRHPRKCRAGGFCTVFQNHQTHVLAGAQHFSKGARSATRRSSANLLCAATRVLHALSTVGLTERLEASLCLLFDNLNYGHVYSACCTHDRGGNCALFDVRATKHSAADRARITHLPPRSNKNGSAYLGKYLDDDVLLAAVYEGNALDCELYAQATDLMQSRFTGLRRRDKRALDFPPPEPSPLRHCARGADELRAFLATRGDTRQVLYDDPAPLIRNPRFLRLPS